LKPITWASLTNSGKAYETTYQARGGDHIFVLIPEPYYEPEEDATEKTCVECAMDIPVAAKTCGHCGNKSV